MSFSPDSLLKFTELALPPTIQNATTLHLAFARAPVLQINNSGSRSKSASISSPAPPPLYGAPLEPATSISTYAPPVRGSSISTPHTISSLKIAKIGVLSRKEDLTEGGRKSASRKWKGWSVVLTASQLLFFVSNSFFPRRRFFKLLTLGAFVERPIGRELSSAILGSRCCRASGKRRLKRSRGIHNPVILQT